ncbi:MAG: saccharopine dehydrogenase C-terminal domain-containing protein [Bacteroidota bacterium]
MTKILIIGAGRSTTSLIEYILKQSVAFNWQVTVGDLDQNLALAKTEGFANAAAIKFDISNAEQRRVVIKNHDLVISMLPAFMHGDVARDCVEFGKHMATASYVSAEMMALNNEAVKKGILLLNECGLDPGIDHASAMKIIDHIKENGGEIHSFKSYCGGLVAPESNDNPWGYKFSWNPRNVVVAGQGTTQFLKDGKLKFIPYNRLFRETDVIDAEGYGRFDAYANRDSIGYINVYGLGNIKTMIRGTLRQYGYCKAWHVFVKLGLTDDTSRISDTSSMTYTSLLDSFLPESQGTVKQKLEKLMGQEWDKEIENMMDYLELFSGKKISLAEGTPAQLLQALLEEKWKLKSGDKDMIVMQHQFEYTLPGQKGLQKLNSSLGVIGKNQDHTAMALTVGLPLAITVKNFLTGQFKLSGVQTPVKKEIYLPLLTELEEHGICFTEKMTS